MNQYIRTSLGVAVIIIMASTIGFFSWTYYQNNLIDTPLTVQPPIKKSEKPMACTEEAKICPDGVNSVGRTETNCEFAQCPEIVGIADKLVIDSPASGEIISSPISVSGRARGTWFFEGSFPVEVYDGNNKLIGTASINFTPKSEQDTWMTTEFVDFKGEVKFTQPKTTEGYLLFKKDNPSDMRELDESFKLPVKFENLADISTWKTYRNEKYGFEFQYPKDWKSPSEWVDDVNNGSSFMSLGCSEIIMGGEEQCPLKVMQNPTSRPEEFLAKEFSPKDDLNGKRSEIKYGQVNGVRTAVFTNFSDYPGDTRYTIFFGNRYYVTFSDYKLSYDKNKIYDKIISTFKFIK